MKSAFVLDNLNDWEGHVDLLKNGLDFEMWLCKFRYLLIYVEKKKIKNKVNM